MLYIWVRRWVLLYAQRAPSLEANGGGNTCAWQRYVVHIYFAWENWSGARPHKSCPGRAGHSGRELVAPRWNAVEFHARARTTTATPNHFFFRKLLAG